MEKLKNKDSAYLIAAIMCMAGVLLVLYLITGKWPWHQITANSYALQADAWRQGRLDLGINYPYLELAVFQGKYYVSFPPFPSYLLFPLTFLFGTETPDGILLVIVNIITLAYLYKTGIIAGLKQEAAALEALLVMVGSNVIFTMIDPSVWFFAQSLCLMLAALTIYHTLRGKGGHALFFWACSVGCRPMQVVFLPVILYLLYCNEKAGEKMFFPGIIKKRWKWCIPGGIVALSYMILNAVRFGSITEFGHNYLPEFTNSEHGQFSIHYLGNNLRMLLNLPEIDEQGRMVIDHFGNLSMLIVSPVIVVFLCCMASVLVKGSVKKKAIMVLLLLCAIGYLIFTMLHKTMGGWHFGNRYVNDILPWLHMGVCLKMGGKDEVVKWQLPFFLFGLCINVIGTCVVYNGW